MLEPRRLAARAVASRMASTLGEQVGATVGYRMRFESRVSEATRIEVVTEGVLTSFLQRDAALQGVGAILFDEFHERSLQADLGLALCLDVQATLRPELRLLIMSATLAADPLAKLLQDAPIVRASGKLYPVEVRYLRADPKRTRATRPTVDDPAAISRSTAAGVQRALREQDGDVLVFLPGAGEIRRTAALLEAELQDARTRILPLMGELDFAAQELALHPAPPGTRKIVLATNIAETSLTIEGIGAVVDSGLVRRLRFDPTSGMSRLQTLRISRASAEQRCGRAGRLGPGLCFRLWTEGAQAALEAESPAEILEADLAPLALDLAAWNVSDPRSLQWLDPPPAAPFDQARELLQRLEALDGSGRITTRVVTCSACASIRAWRTCCCERATSGSRSWPSISPRCSASAISSGIRQASMPISVVASTRCVARRTRMRASTRLLSNGCDDSRGSCASASSGQLPKCGVTQERVRRATSRLRSKPRTASAYCSHLHTRIGSRGAEVRGKDAIFSAMAAARPLPSRRRSHARSSW